MNILIADDHELVRDGLISIITEEFPQASIYGEPSGIRAEMLARNEEWDLVILDISMPDKNGLDILKQLRIEMNPVKVLILSIHPENQYALRVLKAGGNGYIPKDCPKAEFLKALRTVLAGKKYISTSVTEKLISRFDDDLKREAHELISDRELQVLKMIAAGKTLRDIAEELSLSTNTVSTYRTRLMQKMHMKSNAELTLYAINNHLTEQNRLPD